MSVVWEYVFPRCWTPQANPGKKNSRMTSTPYDIAPCGSVVSTNWEFRRKPVPIQTTPRKYAPLSLPTISKVFTAYSLLFFLPTNSTRNRSPPFPGTGIAQMDRRNRPLCRQQKAKLKQISFWRSATYT